MSKNLWIVFGFIAALILTVVVRSCENKRDNYEEPKSPRPEKVETFEKQPESKDTAQQVEYKLRVVHPNKTDEWTFTGNWVFVEEQKRLYIYRDKDTVGDFFIPNGTTFQVWKHNK